MSDRMKAQADANRQAAEEQREHGYDAAADRLEARADALESGQVTDRTDDVLAIIRAASGR
ncbi:hypothetical protein [Streptomyces lasiicapitis]|uniref:hypothetical protein n=1 Tax=Streptomyces lasiicapitis TaxID=1923961 RepID=UPI0036AD09EE